MFRAGFLEKLHYNAVFWRLKKTRKDLNAEFAETQRKDLRTTTTAYAAVARETQLKAVLPTAPAKEFISHTYTRDRRKSFISHT